LQENLLLWNFIQTALGAVQSWHFQYWVNPEPRG